jgi:diaminohydroxyphosphoribosylaminopyrimidine deaminase/5-amino-6-(5-phosphoribosylamino)uracil reductase
LKDFSNTDQSYMQMALTLAARGRGRTSPNPMVGAVIVRDGAVVGRGFHMKAGQEHAETIALREAGELAQGATLYVNLEPCAHEGRTPPCAQAVIEAGIGRVVVAIVDPNPLVGGKGLEALRAAEIPTAVGCLQKQARQLNEFFVTRHEQGRPFVTVKWAMSLCGRTAHDSGQSRWVSNASSREQGHRLRAQHDGVMVGIGTVLSDNPMLNVRLPNYDGQQPKRVVIDGNLSTPTQARLLREREKGEVIIFTSQFAKPERVKEFEALGCRVVVIPSRRRVINLRRVLQELATMDLVSVLIEGGRQIHTSLLTMGLVDKVVAFVSPKLIGGRLMRTPVEDLELPDLDKALVLRDLKWQNFGDDLCIEGYLREI